MDDQRAIDRYRYMLRTAPPDDVERAHAEAFARLTPEQRRMVLGQLSQQVPGSEVPSSDDPQALARMATRAEMRQPGTMERTFSQMPAGPGLGGIFLSTLAGAFIGTAIADAFFSDPGNAAAADAGGGDPASDTAGDSGESGGDLSNDSGAGDSSGDFGGDAGVGDVGGGDFGGGDFGGGDFGDFGGGDFGGF